MLRELHFKAGLQEWTVESGLVKKKDPRHGLLVSRKMRSTNQELRIGRWSETGMSDVSVQVLAADTKTTVTVQQLC